MNQDITETAQTARGHGHLRVIPFTLKQANQFIAQHHRHHKPVVGHRFSLACLNSSESVCGVAIVGRPIARKTEQYRIAEVTRLCTNGERNACSILYSAAARACKEMGFDSIQTFILESESGVSLRASGWECDGLTDLGDWNSREGRAYFPLLDGKKQRWVKRLNV